jgi:hypothetical protein
MNPAEIVVHAVERNRGDMILDLLGESVRQPSKPAHVHSHREVLALDVAGGDVQIGGRARGSPQARPRSFYVERYARTSALRAMPSSLNTLARTYGPITGTRKI